jgi:hypothetical protein
MFDDLDGAEFERQLHQLEQIGYLFESQSVVMGR